MAKRPTWAERRWKLFELAYEKDEFFRRDVTKAIKSNEPSAIYGVLQIYKVPHYCMNAAIAFVQNPNLKREEYLKLILPPLVYWSMAADVIGSKEKRRASTVFAKRFSNRGMTLHKDGKEINPSEAATLISGGHVMLQLGPYLNRTELKELIDDYWDELEPMLQEINGVINPRVGLQLRGKVQPTKTKTHIERDEKIAELYGNHETDYSIRILLRDEGYGDLEENNIKQIRYKLGLTKKRTKS